MIESTLGKFRVVGATFRAAEQASTFAYEVASDRQIPESD
jgi:hypothetical protein